MGVSVLRRRAVAVTSLTLGLVMCLVGGLVTEIAAAKSTAAPVPTEARDLYRPPSSGPDQYGVRGKAERREVSGRAIEVDTSGVVRGTVTNNEGVPLHNAVVILTCYNMPTLAAATGPDGSYEIVGVATDGQYYDVAVQGPAGYAKVRGGYPGDRRSVSLSGSGSSTIYNQKLPRAAKLKLLVTDENGQPRGKCYVLLDDRYPEATYSGDGHRTYETDADGRVEINTIVDGFYQTYVEDSCPSDPRTAVYATKVSEWTPIGEGEVQNVTVALERGGTIAGTVRDESGRPVAGAQAFVWVNDPKDSLWNYDAYGGWRETYPSTSFTDANGRYTFSGIAEGPCLVTFGKNGFNSAIYSGLVGPLRAENLASATRVGVTRDQVTSGVDAVLTSSSQASAAASRPVLVLLAGLNSHTGYFVDSGRGDPWEFFDSGNSDVKRTLGVSQIMVAPTSPWVEQDGWRGVVDSRGSLDYNVDRFVEYLVDHKNDFGGRPIVIVGHSYGGVIARSMLASGKLTDPALKAQIKGVVQFGSPNGGSELAEAANGWSGSHRAEIIKWWKDATEILPQECNATRQLSRSSMNSWNAWHAGTVKVPVVRFGGRYVPDAMYVYRDGFAGSGNRIQFALDSLHKVFGYADSDGAVSTDSLLWGGGKLLAREDFGGGDAVVLPALAHNSSLPGVQGAETLPGSLAEIVPQSDSGAFLDLLAGAIAAQAKGGGAVGSEGRASTGSTRSNAEVNERERAGECNLLPTRVVAVPPGAVAKPTIALDAPTSMVFSSTAGMPVVRVVSPEGSAVPSDVIEYVDSGLSISMVSVDPAKAGTYTLELSLPQGARGDVLLSGSVGAGSVLTLDAPENSLALTPVTVSATFTSGAGGPLLGAALSGVASAEGCADILVGYHDDGANGDATAGDGVYTARFTPPSPGAWVVGVDARHHLAERSGSTVVTVGSADTAVYAAPSLWTTAGPGSTIATLGARLRIGVSVEGTYTVTAPISDSAGNRLGILSATQHYAAGQALVITASIEGAELTGMQPGALTVGRVRVARALDGVELPVLDLPGFTTSSYTPDRFTAALIDLEGPEDNPSPTGAVTLSGTAINTASGVASVEYSTDGGVTWSPATASDGAFGGKIESFTLALSLADGDHAVLARFIGTDAVALPPAQWAGARFKVDTIAPEAVSELNGSLVGRSPDYRARLAWVAPAETWSAAPLKYEVRVDGDVVGTTFGASFEAPLPDSLPHEVTVNAADTAGHIGPSQSVKVGVVSEAANATLLAGTAVTAWGERVGLTGVVGAVSGPAGGVGVTLQSTTGGGWSDVATVDSDSSGAYTFSVTPLVRTSYRVVTEDVPGFMSATSPGVTVTPRVALSVPSLAASAVVGQPVSATGALAPSHVGSSAVTLELFKVSGGIPVLYATVPATCSDGSYAAFIVFPTAGDWRLQARHADDGLHAETRSPALDITVAATPVTPQPPVAAPPARTQPWIGTPRAPKSAPGGKAFRVSGYLKPRHLAGTRPVRIYRWKKVGAKWKPYGYVRAKASNYRSYTLYSAQVRLKRGSWKLRSYHPADSKHTARWSSKSDYVKVK